MKYISAAIIICLLFLFTGCEKKINITDDYLIVPKSDKAVLGKIVNDEIIEVVQLPFPRLKVHGDLTNCWPLKDSLALIAKSYNNLKYNEYGWIAWIDYTKDRIALVKYVIDSGIIHYPDIILPDGFKTNSIALYENILYVGGHSKVEKIGFYDLNKESPIWNTIDILLPKGINRKGKEIDELLIDNNVLIAVDNVEHPKYFFFYDITNSKSPEFIKSQSNRFLTSGSKIQQAILYNDFLIIMSIIRNRYGVGQYLSVINIDDFSSRYFIANHHESNKIIIADFIPNKTRHEIPKIDSLLTWQSIAIIDNLLLMACLKNGTGIFDLNIMDTSSVASKQSTEPIKYIYPKSLPEGDVLNIVSHPNAGKISVLINSNNRLETVILKKEDLF